MTTVSDADKLTWWSVPKAPGMYQKTMFPLESQNSVGVLKTLNIHLVYSFKESSKYRSRYAFRSSSGIWEEAQISSTSSQNQGTTTTNRCQVIYQMENRDKQTHLDSNRSSKRLLRRMRDLPDKRVELNPKLLECQIEWHSWPQCPKSELLGTNGGDEMAWWW